MEYYSYLFSICSITKRPTKYKKEIINENQRNKKTKIVERGITKKIIILYSEIEQIIERRFLLMWQGIEIYLKNGKSYFFNLISKEQFDFIMDVFKNNKITKNKIHLKDFFKTHQKQLISEWQEERLST